LRIRLLRRACILVEQAVILINAKDTKDTKDAKVRSPPFVSFALHNMHRIRKACEISDIG